jgi:hypothetical protein
MASDPGLDGAPRSVVRQPENLLEARSHPFGLKQLIELRLSEAGITTEIKGEAAPSVAGNHRYQHRVPFIGTMDVAKPQEAALEVAGLANRNSR